MKKREVFVEYKLLVFLYAYLRQIDLSLDRSRWTTWDELKIYYKNNIAPGRVRDYLLTHLRLKDSHNDVLYFVSEISKIEKLRCFLLRVVNRNYLPEGQIIHCCKMLLMFDNYLNSNFRSYESEIEKLRVEIAQFNSNVLEHRLWRRDLSMAIKVEHYLQNEKLKSESIETFMKNIEV